jgi:GTPase
MNHKAGFVSILGYPNVGKSTLMNALVGEKLSIVTHKAQTTRHRIKGFVNGEDFQVVYSDTPGIIKPDYPLHKAMMAAVLASLSDADVILLVTEPGQPFSQDEILEKIREMGTPVIVVINKIDLSDQQKVMDSLSLWKEKMPGSRQVAVSALGGFNVEAVFKDILDLLPESPAFYPKDELTDSSERFFVSEMIREKIFLQYAEEIPYSCEVSVESFKEEENITRIQAVIYVARESQKGILLGHEGKAIKKLGTDARKEIEEFIGRHIFLELRVKVEKNWRENDRMLKRFGYMMNDGE